jgi:hypothetical protein
MTESVRSLMTAGVTAAMVAATAVVPISDRTPISVESTAVTLSAALSPLLQPRPAAAVTASATSAGNAIIVAYDTLEPWVAYGFELADWALSFVPGVWWFAPAVDLAYFTAEPIVQSLVYSFAYLIDGEPSLIGPTLAQGINDAATNFVIFGFEWLYSIVPLPPIPPFPSLPFASVAGGAAASLSTTPRVGRAAASAAAAISAAAPDTEANTQTPVVTQPAGDTTAPETDPADPIAGTDLVAETAPAVADVAVAEVAVADVAVADVAGPSKPVRQTGRSAARAARAAVAQQAPAAASAETATETATETGATAADGADRTERPQRRGR